MYDYPDKIKAFISENFTPSTPERANVKLTTHQLLSFLFNAFPMDCITEYNLVEILEALGYTQALYVVETVHEHGKGDNKKIKIEKSLQLGWCLKSPFDLKTEELRSNKELLN